MINQARYRQDYDGEFVVVESRWVKGKKEQTREWVPNPIENQHISGRAACIVSGMDRGRFDYQKLENHRGGLLGSKKLQKYGTGNISYDMKLDFAVEIDSAHLKKIKDSGYHEKNIVYTTARQCLLNPGEFYLIPYNPVMSNEALVLYLAAFDGHKEVFVLGANKDTPASNSAWAQQIQRVIDIYRSTQFIFLGVETNMFKFWFDSPNFNCMTYPEFISYCDC